jgi:hypothetical protein
MKLLSMSFRSDTIAILRLRPKYFAQYYIVNDFIQYFCINPLNADLNPICHLLALLGACLIFNINRIRVNVRYRVAHPYKTTGTTVAFYNLIFMFLYIKWKHNTSHSKW